MKPTPTNVHELLRYEPETGRLFWRVSMNNRAQAGSVADSKSSGGYLKVGIDGYQYFSHRLIWLMVHGEWPAACINHINAIKTDNRLANLESVDMRANTLHAYRLGLRSAKGECNGRAKLSPSKAEAIRQSLGKARDVAAAYGVSVTTIYGIRNGRLWQQQSNQGNQA